MTEYKVVILSAGLSTRMKTTKALLQWDKRVNFIQKIVNEYQESGISKIILVLNNSNKDAILNTLDGYNLNVVINNQENAERINSIKLALSNCSSDDKVFIQDVDQPYITAKIIRKIISKAVNNKYVYPSLKSIKGHPILLCNKIIHCINNEPNKSTTLKDILNKFEGIAVEIESEQVFLNINTPEDYKNHIQNT